MPKISVVVTTYNRKDFLRDTINSILNQTFEDFELIVVDNFSNYNFFSHIDSFNDSRIIPFQNQNNGIIAINRNFGIKRSTGEFIAFCDDDDIWMTDKLESQLNQLSGTQYDIVYSNMLLFKDNNIDGFKITENKNILNIRDLLNKNQVNTSTVMVRNGGILFPEDPKLVTIEDYALWINLYMKGMVFFFDNTCTVRYRVSNQNTSGNNYLSKHLKLIYLQRKIMSYTDNLRTKGFLCYKIIQNIMKYSIKYIAGPLIREV
jgi:teichuronic acid biosynthesis glycosyltransferase TuaG